MKEAQSWLGSVSDMMAGLMMLFLLIAVAFMLEVQNDKLRIEHERQAAVELAAKAERAEQVAEQRAAVYLKQGETIRQIAAAYNDLQVALYRDLQDEFKDDLARWNASIEPDNTVRFNEPDVLFETGKASLQDRFMLILDDFFPRYVAILNRPAYRGNIDEVRIEGHTSSEWEFVASETDRYLKNARLSQERALAVVQYVYLLPSSETTRPWLTSSLRANGLAFARPILTPDGQEDKARSRRVEFRVFTKTKEQILRIIEVSGELEGSTRP